MSALRIRGLHGVDIAGHEPLYRRVPTRDENGRLLSDFMVLIPGLRDWPRGKFTEVLAGMQGILAGFEEVVFADLNVPLNLLWVSVKAKPGIISEVAGSLQQYVPEARLVSPQPNPN